MRSPSLRVMWVRALKLRNKLTTISVTPSLLSYPYSLLKFVGRYGIRPIWPQLLTYSLLPFVLWHKFTINLGPPTNKAIAALVALALST